MAKSENHVRDRLRMLEDDVAHLRGVQHEVQRLLAFAEGARWLARTVLWIACTVGAEMASGGVGRLLSGLAKLLGKGLG